MERTAGIRFPARKKDFCLHSVRTGSGAQPASYPMGTVGLSPGVRQQRREADHSPPPSAEAKNGGAMSPLPTRCHGTELN
jgi:hypothetical protein